MRAPRADIVVQALAHFLHPIESFENRLQTRNLLRLSFLSLEISANHDIEKLIRAAIAIVVRERSVQIDGDRIGRGR